MPRQFNPENTPIMPNNGYKLSSPEVSQKKLQELEGYEGYQKVVIESTQTFQIFHEAVKVPTVILNAFGDEEHQFLLKGATLKFALSNGSVVITGIDKDAFDKTWEVKEISNLQLEDNTK
ncbi:MAG: hypothetical protein IJV31_12005 [Clostridia bacterium]|nr:hypothetical protein [Clostridia bacterium]